MAVPRTVGESQEEPTFEGVLRAWQPSLAPGEEGRTRDTAMFAMTPEQWPGVRTRLVERIERRSTSPKG